ncbi:MAG TPA: class I SAM-dependent methyltransferase [Vicinamibacterales bacterium]|nr:class I SAM-dependent methyltransferase [Vicinamibacterales bacterium]
MDPLKGSNWSSPGTVAGFADSPPNQTLMSYAAAERRRGASTAVDLGCGAGRNLVPLAQQGWSIVGIDLSRPMIDAAGERVAADGLSARVQLAVAPMDALPVASGCADLVIAHGIWNLARSAAEFRRGLREAARVVRPGAALFVFTFSRRTLPEPARPVTGEAFVFTGFSGEPQCFLTAEELVSELAAAGFVPDAAVPLTEHNAPRPGSLRTGNVPVIFEAAFRFAGGTR